ncbi:MAG: ATP-dependent helicase UvrD/PcrA [Acidobacteriota bacterium]|nr:ATP-dependent helicase UvrD/PcrA [Acidobacteriota bacterium]
MKNTDMMMDTGKNDLLETLNPVQKQAVLYLDSPLLIIAGAGSGKTKVITHKIAYLIREKEYSPYNILGVTFTNKAANEMKSRIESLTGIDARFFNISTFHSLGLRILRESGSTVGFDKDWQVIDDGDQKKILDQLVKENLSYFTNDMRDDLKRKINFAKMDLHYPNNKEFLFQKGFNEDEAKIYSLYYNFQKTNKVWDYEDLVSLPAKLFQSYEEIRLKYAEKFRYVVVDEFQDTNPNQYELLRAIAGDHQNITIVGDDDQAIYSWRGASIRFLFNFEDDFPNTHIVKLEQNYRSTPQVLDFANSLITKNTLRRSKSMWTEQGEGNPVYLLNTLSKEDEAEKVAEIITRLQREEESQELFPLAILYRINSQSLMFETEFARQGIDFKIIKGLRFFERKEIKDCLALLKLTLNPGDDISFLRVIDFLPLGIGPKTLENLSNHARTKNLPLFLALKECLPDKFRDKKIFLAIYDVHARIRQQEELPFSEILTRLLKASGYLEFLEDRGEESRQMNIDELIEFIKKWETDSPGETIADLMDRISLDADAKANREENKNKSTCPVYLLTMHNAKGLEFPTVIAAGINASYMPFFMRKDKTEIEEERRLFYVAATRAIKQLIVSVGGDRPSRFLGDISRSLYSTIYSGDDLFESDSPFHSLPERGIEPKVVEEKYLEHPIFGKGKIIAAIDKDRFVVSFAKKGEKVIDTSIAPVTFL